MQQIQLAQDINEPLKNKITLVSNLAKVSVISYQKRFAFEFLHCIES